MKSVTLPQCNVCSGYYDAEVLIKIKNKYICNSCTKDLREAFEAEGVPIGNTLQKFIKYTTNPIPMYTPILEDTNPPQPLLG